MRYALIREMDITNGEQVGISLFVQGCPFHCRGCFNQETWDFDGGQEWTQEIEKQFLEIAGRPYVKRISILGGEPLCDQNIDTIIDLLQKLNSLYPEKKRWVYTGYDWHALLGDRRIIAMYYSDVMVVGPFQLENQDINHKTMKWAGSTNQIVIDGRESCLHREPILHKGSFDH